MGSSNETSHFGPVVNPWQNKNNPSEKLVPGGSSGGSAAAVAEGSCVASMGTDTVVLLDNQQVYVVWLD